MSKVQVTLDAAKLRNLVTKRSYQNKEGQTVEVQEVKFELVPVKDPKQIYAKDNMVIHKTHFASVIQTKEERDAKAPTVYIGEGFTTTWLNAQQPAAAPQPIPAVPMTGNDLPEDDLPF